MQQMAIVDEFPFPFDKPEGQELLRVMAGLYRTEREALIFTQSFGINPLAIPPNLAPINLWYQILDDLAKAGAVRATVESARSQFPNNPRRPFFDALLANKPALVSAEPFSDHGPGFDDTVTKPEALLFFDDLTMPAGKVPNLIATLAKLVAVAPAVCLLRVESTAGSYFGTGFRVGERLILTNHHVLFPKDQVATKVYADFGFDVDVNGASTPVISLPGDASSIKGDKANDWAVVEVPDMKAEWPILPLASAPAPRVGDLAYILQHPGGQQKRLGYVRNMISDVDDAVIKYLTDTEPGSSGSPVLDSMGHLIALHHAGGRPVEIAGKPPVSKNEGVRISRVVAGMKAVGTIS